MKNKLYRELIDKIIYLTNTIRFSFHSQHTGIIKISETCFMVC